jgi:DHA1 family tetracycline resistance protein-like MFS transporter
MAASNYSAANASVADVSSSSEKADRFAKMSMAFGAGFAVGPLLGGILAGDGVFLSENFVRPFLVSGLLSFLNAVAVYLWLPETLSASLSLKQSQVHPLKAIIRDILDIDSSSICLLAAIFFFCFGWGFYAEMIPVWWVTHLNMSPSQVGFFFAYGAMFYVLSCWLIVGPIMARFSHIRIFEMAALLLPIAMWVVFFINTKTAFLCLIPIQNIALSFFFPVGATVLSEHVSKEQQGKIMGLYASAECLGIGGGPAISGVFLGISFLMPVAIGGFMAFLAWILIRQARKLRSAQSPLT